MARQPINWTPYAGWNGAWQRAHIAAPQTWTGEQASRLAFLQDQAERKAAKRKADKNGARGKKGRR